MGKKSLTRSVYEKIFDDVINGRFTANEIVTEGQLMEQYSVSKSPVREALITLCGEKVLQSIPRAGYRVVQIMPQELLQVIEARQSMELYLFEKTFPTLDAEKIQRLKDCNERIGIENNDATPTSKQWKDNVEFHLLLASFSGNQYMCSLLEGALFICARASTQYFRSITISDMHDNKSTHRNFIGACERGELAAAKQYILDDSNHLISLW